MSAILNEHPWRRQRLGWDKRMYHYTVYMGFFCVYVDVEVDIPVWK